MRPEFDIGKILLSYIGYKGLPYPGAFTGMLKQKGSKQPEYDGLPQGQSRQEFTDKGTRLYKKDHLGRWYFMPVTFIADGKEYEMSEAVLSITGKKTIIETPMVGRKGSVKELINIDDYKVSVAGYIQSTDGSYPEDAITKIKELYSINQSVELVSALTDLIFDDGDKVVITDISFPSTPGVEDGQIVKIECVTDKPFELIIES
jgi:hypothetical protein